MGGGKKDPILQALMEPGEHGGLLRRNLEAAVESGAADAALCLQMAELCEARGHPGLALWFLGVGFRHVPEAALDPGNRLGDLVLAAGTIGDYLERRDEKIAGLATVFAALDGLDAQTHAGAMALLARRVSEEPDKIAAMAEKFALEDGLSSSESFLAVLVLVGWEGVAERLLGLKAPKPWTVEALSGKGGAG